MPHTAVGSSEGRGTIARSCRLVVTRGRLDEGVSGLIGLVWCRVGRQRAAGGVTAAFVSPSGTVTFLFTDVEGSTRLPQEGAEDYDAIMATYRDLIRTEPSILATSLRSQIIASTADRV